MKLIESEEGTETTEPATAVRSTNGNSQEWPRRAILIIIAVGIIVGLVFLARWIYHLTQSNTSGSKPSSSQSQAQNNGSSSAGNSAAGGAQSGTNSQKTSGSAANNSQPLPNNGPGNVIGIFAAASFAAGSLHYIISLRKTAREN